MSSASDAVPTRKSVMLETGTVSYLEWADPGRTIHFAHANGFNAETYHALLAPLRGHFHVIASDARGHGFTDLPTEDALAAGWTVLRDDLARTLDLLHPEPIILAGHSLGAIVSMMVAAVKPERVRGLVLIEPVLVPEGSDRCHNPGPPLAEQTKRRRNHFPSFDAALKAYRGRGAFATWPEVTLVDYLKGGLKPDAGGVRLACKPHWEAAIYSGTPVGTAKLAQSVTCPLTMLYGDHDSTVPDSEVPQIAQNGKNRVIKVPGTSHFLPMERPEIVREEIARAANEC